MSLETLLVTKLTGTAGVSAIVGTRVYPIAAQVAKGSPHLTYDMNDEALRCLGGTVSNGLTKTSLTIRCVASGNSAAATLAAAVKTALNGWDDSVNSLHSCVYTGKNTAADQESDGSQAIEHVVTQPYEVWHYVT